MLCLLMCGPSSDSRRILIALNMTKMASLRVLLCKNYYLDSSAVLMRLNAIVIKNVLVSSRNCNSRNLGGVKLNNLVSQMRDKVQKSSRLKSRPSITANVIEIQKENVICKVASQKEERKMIGMGKEDLVCDRRIRELISQGVQRDSITDELEKYYDLDCYPSRKTLEILASMYSKNGNVDGVVHVQRMCAKMYPKEYAWMMGYQHNLAEAKWKAGLYKESLAIFSELFANYPLRRRKLCNMTNFLMRHLLNNSLENHYDQVRGFALECAALGSLDVASNLWRASFLSRTIQGQEIGKDLLEQHPALRGFVPAKLPGLIEVAYERNDIDILQRLVQTALQSQLTDSYSLLLSALLNFQCETEDVKGAMETFKYTAQEKVVLSASTVQRFMALLSQSKKKAPSPLLDSKYKIRISDGKFQLKW